MGILYGYRKVTLWSNSGGEGLERAVLKVLSVDCSFDKVFHPFLQQELRVW